MLTALLTAALAAAAPVKNPGVFVMAETREVTSLDPALPFDAPSHAVIFNVYETLVAFEGGRPDKLTARLAARVPSRANGLISRDERTYRFPIRAGVRFHDGSPLTAEDARYSLLRFMLTDRAGGPSAMLLEPVLGLSSTRDPAGGIIVDYSALERAVRVEGDTLVVTLKRPFAPFLSVMATWSYVVPKAWAIAHGEWDGGSQTWRSRNNPEKESSYLHDRMNGTGPFKLERWDKAAKEVHLARHDGYWRKPAALERAAFKALPDFSTRRLMLQAGDADLIAVPRPLAGQLEGLEGVRVLDDLPWLLTDPAILFSFRLRTDGNPDAGSGALDGEGIPADFFHDADARKGFAYAFDYDAFLRDAFKGKARRATSPIHPSLLAPDPRAPRFTHDLKRATMHLRRAHGGRLWEKGFRATFSYANGSEHAEIALRVLKARLEALNPRFRVELRGLDWSAYLDRSRRGLLPVFCVGWSAVYPDAHNFVYPFYHPAGLLASAQGYANPRLGRLIEQALGQPPARRAALYREIARLGFEDAPSILTAHPPGLYAMRDWLRGFQKESIYPRVELYPLSK